MKSLCLALSFFCCGHELMRAQPAAEPAPANREFHVAQPPPLPRPSTNLPIQYLRRLLDMSPQDREADLARKAPGSRKFLEAKLREFEPLTPENREIRLRVLQLQASLPPLLRTPATNRGPLLASVPAEDLQLINNRLRHWDILPPALQRETLTNELAMRYYYRLEASTPTEREEMLQGMPKAQRALVEREIARIQSLPPAERQRIFNRARSFFELSGQEKSSVLSKVPAPDRTQVVNAISTLEKMPSADRQECLAGFQKYTQLSPQERELFLKKCDLWNQLTPAEQQKLRDTVKRVGSVPPLPPMPRTPSFPPKGVFDPQLGNGPVPVKVPER